MQSRVPVSYRQSFKWYGNLDATSLGFIAGGGIIAIEQLNNANPFWEKAVVGGLALGFGCLLGFGRWPIEYGDNAMTWLRRVLAYRSRSHEGRLVRSLTVADAVRRHGAVERRPGSG